MKYDYFNKIYKFKKFGIYIEVYKSKNMIPTINNSRLVKVNDRAGE